MMAAVGRLFDQYSVICVFGSVVGCVVVPLITQVSPVQKGVCTLCLLITGPLSFLGIIDSCKLLAPEDLVPSC